MIKRKIFGLDISDHSIEALIFKKPFFGKIKASSYARSLLKGDIVNNGTIKKPKKLEESIIKLLSSAQPKPIKTPYCVMSLPESQVFMSVFKLPAGLRHDEIKKTIPYKAEEAIPFDSSEVYFDFKVIKKHGSSQEVFYVAVPAKIVDSYVEVLKNVGLKPVAFDLESISLARALLKTDKKSPGKMIIDIGARTSNLAIFDSNGIRQSLIVRSAGNRFTKAIAKSLGISEKSAEEKKVKDGLDEKKQKPKALKSLKSELNKIISEAKKFIEYYQLENQIQVDEVILAGGSAMIPKIDKYFFESLKIKSSICDPFFKISADNQEKLKKYGVMFSNVSGLALRGILRNPKASDINLLPFLTRKLQVIPEKSNFKAWIPFYIRLLILVILLFVFGGVFYLRNIGVDFYSKIFPADKYESKITTDFDLGVIDELRRRLIDKESEEEGSVELTTEIRVLIKQTPAGSLNIRNGPSTNYELIGSAVDGQNFKFIEEKDDWYRISMDEESDGWVISTYAELVELEIGQIDELSPEVRGVSAEFDYVMINDISSGYLNVRSQPGTDNEKIGQVSSGQKFQVLAEVNGWYKIEYDQGNQGWIFSEYASPVEKNY